jgi:hypothetical protein
MAEVKGVGGAFILSEDPERLAAWYRDALSLQLERHSDGKGFYQVFPTRDPETSMLRANPIVEDPYGLFPAVVDIDGNRIELYEERFPE